MKLSARASSKLLVVMFVAGLATNICVAAAAVSTSQALRQTTSSRQKQIDAIERIKKIRESILVNLQATQKKMTESIQSSQTISLQLNTFTHLKTASNLENQSVSKDEHADRTRLQSLVSALESLQIEQDRLIDKLHITNRLISVLESRYRGQDLKSFLETQFLDLTLTNLTADNSENERALWKFYLFASVAIREVPDAHDDALTFLENYISHSPAKDPQSPSEWVRRRIYLAPNGTLTDAAREDAKPVSAENAGDGIEEKLKKQGYSTDADGELRLKVKTK